MFEVPDAKRMKRSHLFQDDSNSHGSRVSSRSASPVESINYDGKHMANLDYSFEYDFVAPRSAEAEATATEPSARSQPPKRSEEPDEAEGQEYQFRLFAPGPRSKSEKAQPSTSTSPANVRIRLSATPTPGPLADSLSVSLDTAHFIRPHRPDESYYFTSALPHEAIQALHSQYEDVALSTLDVLSRAKSSQWPGTALPWRLVHVELLNKASSRTKQPTQSTQPTSLTQPLDSSHRTQNTRPARTKPSKKRRILQRRRLALRNERAAQMKTAEETEREKRTRRNREKKVKRKEREKRKKVELDGVGDDNDANDDDEDGGGEGEGEEPVREDAVPNRKNDINMKPARIIPTEEYKAEMKREPGQQPLSTGPMTETSADDESATATPSTAASQPQPTPPTRRTPTSRAPTAVATAAPTGKAKQSSKRRHQHNPQGHGLETGVRQSDGDRSSLSQAGRWAV